MKKYVCDVCGWVYDPAVGGQRLEYQQVHHLRNFPMISSVLFAQ